MVSLAFGLALLVHALFTPEATATQQAVGQGTIEGIVRADSGEPVVGAEVSLSGPRNLVLPQTTTPVLRWVTTTNGKGEFSFKNLDPGSYALRASAPGFDSRAYGQESRTSTRGMSVSLVGYERIAANIQLPRLGVINGRVLNEVSLEPLPHVPVDLQLPPIFEGTVPRTRPVTTTTTDDRGEYRLYGVPPGRYYLSVGTAGTALVPQSVLAQTPGRVSQSFALRFFPGVGALVDAELLNVRPGAELRIDLRTYAKPMYTIRGSVEDGAKGRPAEAVRFYLDDAFFPSQTYDPVTGAFEIRNVAAGSYTLLAQSRVLDDVAKTVNVDDVFVMAPAARVPVHIVDSEVADIPLRLWRPVAVSGRVRLDSVAGGAPPPRVILQVRPIDNTARIPTPSSGNDGTFKVYGLVNGSYRVSANAPQGFHVKSIRFGLTDILNGPFWFSGTAAESDRIEVVLGEGTAQVTGTVTDSLSRPVGGAQVVLLAEPRWRTVLLSSGIGSTDQSGRFSLDNVPPGNYKVFAWAATEEVEPTNPEYMRPFEPLGITVHIPNPSAIQLDIHLIPRRAD